MTSRRARRGAAVLALCLGLTAPATAGCLAGGGPGQGSAAADGPATTAAAVRTSPPVVMILGDSYTVGERGVRPETTYASAAARLLGWQVVLGGRGGTGFVKTTSSGRDTFLQLFESQLGWRPAPDMLLVSGGHNDWKAPPAEVAAAAHVVLERARQRWAGTRLVLMGPLWGDGSPPQRALAVRDALRGLAVQLGIPFIDPIAGRWITGGRFPGMGNALRYIKRDGTHPTPAGHRYLATRLAEDIRRLGLAQPRRKP